MGTCPAFAARSCLGPQATSPPLYGNPSGNTSSNSPRASRVSRRPSTPFGPRAPGPDGARRSADWAGVLVFSRHPLAPPATPSRPGTPWHRPPHRPGPVPALWAGVSCREGRCALCLHRAAHRPGVLPGGTRGQVCPAGRAGVRRGAGAVQVSAPSLRGEVEDPVPRSPPPGMPPGEPWDRAREAASPPFAPAGDARDTLRVRKRGRDGSPATPYGCASPPMQVRWPNCATPQRSGVVARGRGWNDQARF